MSRRTQSLESEYDDLFCLAGCFAATSHRELSSLTRPNDLQTVVLYHAVRACRLLRAVVAVCRAGVGFEAFVLLRSLYNLVVNVNWLLHCDTQQRLERFKEYEFLRRWAYHKTLLESGTLSREERIEHLNSLKSMEPELQRLLGKYEIKNVKQVRNWSGKGLAQMAEELGIQDPHALQYPYLSEIEHSGPHIITHYLSRQPDGTTAIKQSRFDCAPEFPVLQASRYCRDAVAIAFRECSLTSDDFARISAEIDERYARLDVSLSLADGPCSAKPPGRRGPLRLLAICLSSLRKRASSHNP